MSTSFAKILSYIFHPAIYPVLGVWVVLETSPAYINREAVWFTLALVFTGTYVFPLLISFGLYKVGMVKSLEMHSRAERRLPYLIGAACYYITSLFLKKLPLPEEAFLYLMAAALLILIHLISFAYLKPSAHLGSVAGFTALLVVLSLRLHISLLLYLSFCFVTAGFVASARLKLQAHTPRELVYGYATGLLVVGGIVLWV